MKNNIKYTFFIEGGDNVGKTTTIENFKDCKYVDRLLTHRLSFDKYPSYRITQYLNDSNKRLREYSDTNDITAYQELNSEMINTLLSDMEYAFASHYSYMDLGDMITIADRGPLSTYIYQYKTMIEKEEGITNDIQTEKNHFYTFILSYLSSIYNHLSDDYPVTSIVILNNNKPDIKLNTDTSETIEYKKEFDKDTELQQRVNRTLSNIIELTKEDESFNLNLHHISGIRIYYIDIYTEEGKRKSTNTVTEELLSIINKRVSEQQNSEDQ